MCGCYADSIYYPFDECEGSEESCRIAKCAGNACEGLDAYCDNEADGGYCNLRKAETITETTSVDGTEVVEINLCPQGQCLNPDGQCELEVACFVDPCDVNLNSCQDDEVCAANYCGGCNAICLNSTEVIVSDTTSTMNSTIGPSTIIDPDLATITSGGALASSSTVVTAPTAIENDGYNWSATCTTDEDCYPSQRTYEPGDSETIGVFICQCYANSYLDPMDECQGDSSCIAAMCLVFPCDGLTTYCSDEGVCELSESALDIPSTSIATIATPDTSSFVTTIADPVIVINETMSNEVVGFVPEATKPTPVTTSVSAEMASADINAINETSSDEPGDITTDFGADGTSSTSSTVVPDVAVINEMTSTEAPHTDAADTSSTVTNNASENFITHNESEAVQLETSSTISNQNETENESEGNATEMSTTVPTASNKSGVSENIQSEVTPDNIDKSEKLASDSAPTSRAVMTGMISLATMSWLIYRS